MSLFTEHPQSIGESYWKHMRVAIYFGIRMVLGGIACILHGFFPFIFQTTASQMVLRLAKEFNQRQDKTKTD